MSTSSILPDEAGTLIVGAGCVGCSAAYHLSELGREDVVVVDQGPLFETGGSTSHAPGLVFQTAGNKLMSKMAQYTRELYDDLGGFRKCGGIEVAYTEDRWEFLKRKREWSRSFGVEDGELLSPSAVEERVPQINADVIHGGFYVPSDGKAHAVEASEEMANLARERGAEFYGNTKVIDLETDDGEIDAVVTEHGRIEADEVLLATNIWGPLFGEMVDVDVPLKPCAHQYLVSDSIDELAGSEREIEQPILRHQDRSLYFRQHGDAYGIGSYNHDPLLVEPEDIYGPDQLDDLGLEYPSLREFTAEHFVENTHPDHEQPAFDAASELIPAFEECDWETEMNGMFCFTTDGMPILGETEDIDGLWWALAVWVTQSGGVGNVIAEWMENGTPRLDGERVDATGASIDRFQGHHGADEFVRDRAAQQYREVYQLTHPRNQPKKQRGLRRSPYYPRQQDLGAEFYASDGWESPQWYEANEALLDEYDVPDRPEWIGRNWSKAHGAEHQAVRDRVGLYDLTSFTAIEVRGSGSERFLQGLLSNDIDVSPGRVRYTTMLNEDGGILADLTVSRLDEDRFLILTGGGSSGTTQGRWIRDHAPDDGTVEVIDRTSARCGLGVWGPNARKTLEGLVETDISHDAFPFFSCQETYVGGVPVTMLRVSFVGELGWELYAPQEYGAQLWDAVWDAGEEHGVLAMGDATLNSMSMEKGFRLWGTDISPEYNPYEANLSFAVDMETDFIGKEALAEAKESGIERRLVPVTLDEPGAVVDTGHPIVDGDEILGYTTRADYGYTIDAGIAYAYLPTDYTDAGQSVEVEYEGERFPTTVRNEPLFDSDREKILR
ncbi:sacrosine dehydrogenase/glycine cleavage T-protein [Haladaptatus paucihalophilus DX253]|uniref:Glycine cleavage system T protein (Aminomethyltransferase) n=1 Tax=Haladaptatus paucihalophilus DX253 TaxID=797209 RepID=E7QZQ1_HALPU|nr:FAD-dependent oxidoreductase [Haladaptatus paucihalophilus]EFW90172.1 sacrosine dehydrogenase/glycine cleavage T-protein [Haladaptatus paucihalophilus DX253]SHL07623.1 Glycine cleavage system T protein (aminomethyltransferase) [Haladaptatus paucihalophilus DX253]